MDRDDHKQVPVGSMIKYNNAVDRPDEAEPESPKSVSGNGTDPTADSSDTEPVRRALIRATLKPNEGAPPVPRPAPVFTMHEQPQGGKGASRGGRRPTNSQSQRDNGHPNRKKIKTRSRQGQHIDRNGQTNSGRSSRSVSSRRGKSRQR